MKNTPTAKAKRKAKQLFWKATLDLETVPKTRMRVCKSCGEYKPCNWMRSFTSAGVPEYRNRCHECYNQHLRKHRAQPSVRKQLTKTIGIRRRELKQQCIDILGGKCKNCGYNKSPKALTFHHREPKLKTDDVCKMIMNNSWKLVLKELEKCDLLCFNCHMENHA